MQMEHSFEKNVSISSLLDVCIGFRVSSTFGHFRSVSDKSQTMSGLPGVPNDAASQTI